MITRETGVLQAHETCPDNDPSALMKQEYKTHPALRLSDPCQLSSLIKAS